MRAAAILILTFALISEAQAERFAVPSGLKGDLILMSPTAQTVYQKNPIRVTNGTLDRSQPWEEPHRLSAGESQHIALQTLPTAVQFVASDPLKVFVQLPSGGLLQLSDGLANRQTLLCAGAVGGSGTLTLTNLSPIAQKITVTTGGLPQSLNLEADQSKELTLSCEDQLEIGGEGPLTAAFSTSAGTFLFTPLSEIQNPQPAGAGVLFLVSNSSSQFIARIESPDLILQARSQLQNPTAPGGHILIAEIAEGSAGENLNMTWPYRFWWSWHVKSVIRFAELASQACDGNPDLVQDVLPAWLGGVFTGARPIICFWNYRVTKEL